MTTHALLAYLAGELDESTASHFEEQLMAGELDGEDLSAVTQLLVTLREAAFTGTLNLAVSPAEIEKVRALGYRIIVALAVPGENTSPSLDGDFDLLHVAFTGLDLSNVERLDFATCDPQGRELKRAVEIPFSPEQTRIEGFCTRDLALAGQRMMPDGNIARVIDVRSDGTERVIAEFRIRYPR